MLMRRIECTIRQKDSYSIPLNVKSNVTKRESSEEGEETQFYLYDFPLLRVVSNYLGPDTREKLSRMPA